MERFSLMCTQRGCVFAVALVGLLLGCCPVLSAQQWEASIVGGGVLTKSDLPPRAWGAPASVQPLVGLSAGYRWASFAAVLQWQHFQLADRDTRYPQSIRQLRRFYFRTPSQTLAATLAWTPLPQARFQPFVFGGLGLLHITPQPDFTQTRVPELAEAIRIDQNTDFARWLPFVPLGLGLEWQWRTQWRLQLATRYHWLRTDYLDGISRSVNPNDGDSWAQFSLGLIYQRPVMQDTDGDGIADEEDDCPLFAGLSALGGCPDADGDGLVDQQDACPQQAGSPLLAGCPDRDNDGIADRDDDCPDAAGSLERRGCPVVDTDRDGTPDDLDLCPQQAGPPARRGCPPIDTDGDGILDEDDGCPNEYGPMLFRGCPDADADGIPDHQDACPDSPGAFAQQGCPLAKSVEEEARLIQQQWLLFGPDDTRTARTVLLERVTQFLQRYPHYHILIRGHADPSGSDSQVPEIAYQRAQTIFNLLLQRGIPLQQLHYEGLGGQYPVGLTATPYVQAQNRRVELWLYPVIK